MILWRVAIRRESGHVWAYFIHWVDALERLEEEVRLWTGMWLASWNIAAAVSSEDFWRFGVWNSTPSSILALNLRRRCCEMRRSLKQVLYSSANIYWRMKQIVLTSCPWISLVVDRESERFADIFVFWIKILELRLRHVAYMLLRLSHTAAIAVVKVVSVVRGFFLPNMVITVLFFFLVHILVWRSRWSPSLAIVIESFCRVFECH